MRTALTIPLIALSLGACSLAPVYERPQAPVAAAWKVDGAGSPRAAADAAPSAAADAAPSAAADIGWRDFYAEPALRRLIDRALEHNRDLRIAILNIEAARAQYGIRRADELPTLGAGASASRQRVPADLSPTGRSTISDRYQVDIGVTGFELDFFGRVRSLEEQALQTYLGTEDARRSAQISLVAEVASAWLRLAADRERLALAKNTQQTRQESLDLVRRSFELGAVSALDVHQADTLLQSARADAARFETVVAQDQNALAQLVGGGVPAALLPDGLEQAVATVAELPAGVPSEVLTRRPDIVQAERALRAANANIGAARAAFFPRITLTASAGTASSTLDGLFEGGSGAWSFVPQLRLPIFEAGRLQASLDVAEIQRDINVAQYEKAIQSAFREVADSLAERATITERIDARRKQVAATQNSLKLSDARYRGGVDSYLSLLDAQRSLYAAEQELIAVRLADATNRVELYKALGGGWQ